jgi:hypothetical protein
MTRKNWLLFVEDPGAVNFFAPLIHEIRRLKISHEIFASGLAIHLLKKRDIESRRYQTAGVRRLLKNSSLLVVGTSENLDTPAFRLVDLARKIKTPSAAIVDSSVNAEFRFRGRTADPLFHAPNHILVPDQWTRQAYQKIGYPRSQLSVVGRPVAKAQLSRNPKSSLGEKIKSAKKEGRHVVVFVSEISSGLNADQYKKTKDYKLHGRGRSILRTEIVVEEFLDAIKKVCKKRSPRPFLVLRRHPKETSGQLKELVKEFDAVSTKEDPIEVIKKADLVVGMSSMLLEEAYFSGVRVLIVVPRSQEKDWLEISRRSLVLWTSQRNAFIRHLASILGKKGLPKRRSKKYKVGASGIRRYKKSSAI